MSIYVALTQIKISDESGLRHTARQADLRRRATAPADEAARAAMAIPAPDTRTPQFASASNAGRWRGHYPVKARRNPVKARRNPVQARRNPARAGRTGRINRWRTSRAALAPKAPAGGYAA